MKYIYYREGVGFNTSSSRFIKGDDINVQYNK